MMPRIGLSYDRQEYGPEIEYSVASLLRHLGLSEGIFVLGRLDGPYAADVHIHYGSTPFPDDGSVGIRIRPSGFFETVYATGAPLPFDRHAEIDGIPLVFHDDATAPHVVVEHSETVPALTTNADIVAASFLCLTRYEEARSGARDEHERFPAAASLAHANGWLERPLVDEYADLIRAWIERIAPRALGDDAASKRSPVACITHDVDVLRMCRGSRMVKTLGRDLVVEASVRMFLRRASVCGRHRLGRRLDPYDTFDEFLAVSEEAGAPSTYFIQTARRTSHDTGYFHSDSSIRGLLSRIADGGHEIGLHTSYGALDAPGRLRDERAMLQEAVGQEVRGVRHHYLRWSGPASWRAHVEAGFTYDSSVSYAEAEGFRCGTSLPFRPFDIDQRVELPLWEVPLTVMDGTLKQHRGLSPSEGLERIVRLAERVREARGVFVLLWHNSSLNEIDWPGWRDVYKDAVAHLAGGGFAMRTLCQVVDGGARGFDERRRTP